MKNKILYILLTMFFTISASNASDKIHVSAMESFSTTNPSSSIDVKVIEDGMLDNYELHEGTIIHCNILKINNPQRGKRSASFKVMPVYYTYEGQETKIEQSYTGKYAEKILSAEELKNVDAVKVGKKAAITVGNHFVKGVAPVASLAEGMIKNEDGNRIKSGVKKVYKNSVFSYVEKGQNLNLEPGSTFYLIFTQDDE